MHRIVKTEFKRKSICISQLKRETSNYTRCIQDEVKKEAKPSIGKASSLDTVFAKKKNPKKYGHQETFGLTGDVPEAISLLELCCASCKCSVGNAQPSHVPRCGHPSVFCGTCKGENSPVFSCAVCFGTYCTCLCKVENYCGHTTCRRCTFRCKVCDNQNCVTCLLRCHECMGAVCSSCSKVCQVCYKVGCLKCNGKWDRKPRGELVCGYCVLNEFRAELERWEKAKTERIRQEFMKCSEEAMSTNETARESKVY